MKPRTLLRKARLDMRYKTLLPAILVGAFALAGCEEDFVVPNLNNPELVELSGNPTVAGVIDATQGLMIGARFSIDNQTGFIPMVGLVGREILILDNSDPSFLGEVLAGALDPGRFGGVGWLARYANLRQAEIVLDALEDQAIQAELGAGAVEGIRGFVKTMKAIDLLVVVMMRDVNGAVIDVDVALGETPGPIVSKAAALDEIARLLDEAQGHLQAAGGSFAFNLSSGFDGFDDPAAFIGFNRALLARVRLYQDDYPGVLQALGGSFIATGGPLDMGVYWAYSTNAGDDANSIAASANIFGHPSLVDEIQTKPNGDMDDRAAAKLLFQETSRLNFTTPIDVVVYPTQSSAIPIIRNEELILTRAEARWFTGDRAGALADLNFVRTSSGGLAPIAMPATDQAFVTALLQERLWSLLLEGHRWVDMRRFDRLDQLPLDRPTDRVAEAFLIPDDECLARSLPVPCSA